MLMSWPRYALITDGSIICKFSFFLWEKNVLCRRFGKLTSPLGTRICEYFSPCTVHCRTARFCTCDPDWLSWIRTDCMPPCHFSVVAASFQQINFFCFVARLGWLALTVNLSWVLLHGRVWQIKMCHNRKFSSLPVTAIDRNKT